MKHRITTALSSLVFILLASKGLADEEKYFLLPQGSRYGSADHSIAVEDIRKLPELRFPEEELPLSPRQASLMALEGFRDCFHVDATVRQIDLCRFPDNCGLNRYYYYILLSAPSERMRMGKNFVDTTTVSFIVPVVNEPKAMYSRAYRVIPKEAEQAGTVQPATRPESKSEGGNKPQPESEGRSR